MKKSLVYSGLCLLSFVVNFAIYNISFNNQATPHLHEEQRLDSALLMLKTTLPAFLMASIILTLIIVWTTKKIGR